MESVLLEKFKNNTCDDIDKAMIVSRVKKAMGEIYAVAQEFSDKIDVLRGKYFEEIKMSGMTILCMAKDHVLIPDDKAGLEIVIGEAENCREGLLLIAEDMERGSV